jgi:hypothetical protein
VIPAPNPTQVAPAPKTTPEPPRDIRVTQEHHKDKDDKEKKDNQDKATNDEKDKKNHPSAAVHDDRASQ